MISEITVAMHGKMGLSKLVSICIYVCIHIYIYIYIAIALITCLMSVYLLTMHYIYTL